MTQLHDHSGLSILFNDKLPLYRFHQVPTTPTLCYLNLISLLNARSFKYFDLLADQIPAKVAVVGYLGDDKFRELVVLRILLAYSELQKSS